MEPKKPIYVTRWYIDGTPFHFAKEAQARAFAKPGQPIVPVSRRIKDTDPTLEFLLGQD